MKNVLLPAFQHMASFFREWVSLPLNGALAALCLCLIFSSGAWLMSGPRYETLLYFASPSGRDLEGETRMLPLGAGIEKNATLLCSELMLGPRSRRANPLFAGGTRVESLMFRSGNIYVDLSPEASLSMDPPLTLGLKAMKKTLAAGLPGRFRVVITVGGLPGLPKPRVR
jgi:hypothetical protein